MLKTETCPPQAVLNDFGLGKLEAADETMISQHLETCAGCRQRVASLPADSFVGRLRQADGHAQPAAHRPRTYVAGEPMADSAGKTDGSLIEEGGLPRPSRQAGDARQEGFAASSSLVAPAELASQPDYELLKELGQGGMGTVYLAKNRMMDRLEVLKVISKSLLDRPGALERFQQEIRSAAKLSHPNIVAAYSVLRPGELLVFAMEYVRGQDLSQVVKQRGPLPVANAAFYVHQIANGLQHAFEKGMVHRDIKPNNLMLAIEGKKHVVKILDFGLAKATSEKGAEAGLTKSGQMLGTPDYVAPEQTLAAHKADIRADIYSLGCTLYFLLSGGPPFQEASLYEILEAHHKRDPKPLNLVRPDVKVELATVVAKMMAKDPTKRYQTPVEVARALVPFFKPGQSDGPLASVVARPQVATETAHGLSVVTPPPVGAPPSGAFPVPVARAVAAATAPAPQAGSEPDEVFGVSINTRLPMVKRRDDWWRSLPPWRRWALAAVPAAIALILGIVILVRTPHGSVKLELSDRPANLSISVDGEGIDIAGLDEPLSLKVGEHDLTVRGAGYETITKKFTVTRGANAPLVLTLIPNESDGHWVALFNGKDLTGWKPEPESPTVWRVENGILTGSGEASSYLFTERGNLTNFHLRVEARINDRGDSGVYFRATPGGGVWPKGYEAQINTWDKSGEMTGSLFGWGGAGPITHVADSPAKSNEWFTLEIIATDDHFVVKVNGKATADYVDAARRFPMGHIALEKYRAGTVVEFRKIEIRESDPARSPNDARNNDATADAKQPDDGITTQTVDLIKLFDPTSGVLGGKWTKDNGVIACHDQWGCKVIEFPFVPPAEYDFRIEFVAPGGFDAMQQVCHARAHRFVWTLSGRLNTVSGFGDINGVAYESTATRVDSRGWIQRGSRHASLVKVRTDGVEAYFDGKLVSRLSTDYSDMSLPDYIRLRQPTTLGLAHWGANLTIEAAEVVPIHRENPADSTAKMEKRGKNLPMESSNGTDKLKPGSVWKGKRTYRHGGYSPSSVTYELHLREREGAKFKGHVFDNGPGRNRAEVEGEIDGNTISWRERALHMANLMTMKGALNGDTIELTFHGTYPNGATNDGDGELKLTVE